MDFFIDRSVPEKLARMLGHYDRKHQIIYLDDQFEHDTPDVAWLSAIAQRDPVPVVLSGDGRILKNPAELQVLQGLSITFFLFADSWCNLKWDDYAWKAIKVWPQVVKAASPSRPSIFRIPISAVKVDFVEHTNRITSRRKR